MFRHGRIDAGDLVVALDKAEDIVAATAIRTFKASPRLEK